MNALTWLKEYAARSQTADALENVKKQAHADAANTFSTLIEQDQRRSEMADTFAGRNDLERIQQSGPTDRARIESRDKALAAAAALKEHQDADLRAAITETKGMTDSVAADAFGTARNIPSELRGPLVSNIKTVAEAKSEAAKVAAKAHRIGALAATIKSADTATALQNIIPLLSKEDKDEPEIQAALAIALPNAAVKDRMAASTLASQASLREKRDNPPAKVDVGRLITIENKIKALQAQLTSGELDGYTPGGTLNPKAAWYESSGTAADPAKEKLIKDIRSQIAFYKTQKDAMMIPATGKNVTVSGMGYSRPAAAAPSSEDALTAELLAYLKSPAKKP